MIDLEIRTALERIATQIDDTTRRLALKIDAVAELLARHLDGEPLAAHHPYDQAWPTQSAAGSADRSPSPALVMAKEMSDTQLRATETIARERDAACAALRDVADALRSFGGASIIPEGMYPAAGVAPLFQRFADKVTATEHALRLVLPLAKGYAAAHPVGSNQAWIQQAEAALSDAADNAPEAAQ